MQFGVIERMHSYKVAEFVVRRIFVSVMNLESIGQHHVRVPHPYQVTNVDACSLSAVVEVYARIAMFASPTLVDPLNELAARLGVYLSIFTDVEHAILKPFQNVLLGNHE